MPDEITPSEAQTRVRDLLGKATLLRARGQRQEALRLVQQAASLDGLNWEAHELAGDLLLELGRGELALESYRRAREINPSRAALEDKLARAALARAAKEQVAVASEALLSGRMRPLSTRKPGYAALASAIVPGLGQVYNGEVLKGFVVVLLFLVCFALTGVSLRGQISASPMSGLGSLYGPRIDLGAIVVGMFSGVSAVWVILSLIVWVYAIADAAIRASRTGTSDSTGLV